MRVFQIKVMGQVYEVEVEELDAKESPAIKNIQVVEPPAHTAALSPIPAAAPAAAAAPAVAPKIVAMKKEGSSIITSPMPGKITSVAVKVGQTINYGDLVVVLEAMKMDNEIFSHASGTVIEIRVASGASVNPGDEMVIIA